MALLGALIGTGVALFLFIAVIMFFTGLFETEYFMGRKRRAQNLNIFDDLYGLRFIPKVIVVIARIPGAIITLSRVAGRKLGTFVKKLIFVD